MHSGIVAVMDQLTSDSSTPCVCGGPGTAGAKIPKKGTLRRKGLVAPLKAGATRFCTREKEDASTEGKILEYGRRDASLERQNKGDKMSYSEEYETSWEGCEQQEAQVRMLKKSVARKIYRDGKA
eukprot:6202019-Pleurochrysis_carterae.AAC.1